MRSVLTLLAASLAACAPEAGGPGGASQTSAPAYSNPHFIPRETRLAGDAAALEARLEGMNLELHRQVLRALRKIERQPGDSNWIEFDGRALRCAEFEYYREWHVAQDGAPAAVESRDRDGDAFSVIKFYADNLAERGIDLIVVPVPTRVQLYPDIFPTVPKPEADFRGLGPGYTQLLLDLTRAGVEVLDLLPDAARARFASEQDTDEHLILDYDHHWTPRGVALIAERIAQRVRQLEWFKPGTEVEERGFVIKLNTEEWVANRNLRHAPEIAQQPQVLHYRSVLDREGKKLRDVENASPVLLIGDSMVGMFRLKSSGLASHLGYQLGLPVDSISIPAGGGDAVWKALALRDEPFAGKRVIIWLFTAKALAKPMVRQTDLFEDS